MSDTTSACSTPRQEARRRAFLEAGTTVFLEKGFANATLDDVIARSGGSRQTLYAMFGCKQGLFEAIIEERGTRIFGSLASGDTHDRPPEQMLEDLAIRYLEMVLTPESIGLYRLVVAESISMKGVCERFWTFGPRRSRALVADYFAQQTMRGVLRIDDPERASHQFVGMLLGDYHMQCLLGVRELPDSEEITAYAAAAVSRFLDGCKA